MGNILYQWLDLIWLPLAWFVVHPQHRWLTLAFIVACGATMRTQVELMNATGFTTGILPLLDAPLFTRGLLGYGFVIAVFLALAYFSRATAKMIFFAAAISVYIFAFCFTMILMLL